MKKLTLKFSALLLCLFCLFGAVACGQDSPGTNGISQSNSNSTSETLPKSGDTVTLEYLDISYEDGFVNENYFKLRIRPLKDVEGVVLIVRFYGYSYEQRDIFLQSQLLEVGDMLYGEEYIFSLLLDPSKIIEEYIAVSNLKYEVKHGTFV